MISDFDTGGGGGRLILEAPVLRTIKGTENKK